MIAGFAALLSAWTPLQAPNTLSEPLTRRSALAAAFFAAPLTLVAGPTRANAGYSPTGISVGKRPISDTDPLTERLRELRADLDAAVFLLNDRNFDAVRKVTDEVGTAMTFSGYTGESVKARAAAWATAGDMDLSKAIVLKRNALARKVNELANAVYTAQSNKAKMAPNAVDEMQVTLAGIAADMDSLLPLMGCEERWASGKCEILPAPGDRQLTDLIAGSKF